MVCTDGDNESMMAPFKDLEEASPPKLGVVTMGVDSIDAIAPLFSKYFDMEWTETDPAGFGSRAVVGKHRVKLVEKPDPALSAHFMQSLIAAEMMFDDPESGRARIEAVGFPGDRKERIGGKGVAGRV